MGKKISVNDTMNDIVYLKNQIAGLTMLLDQKKSIMAKYFDKTGNRTVSNDDCTVYVAERTNIEYDIDKLKKKLPPKILKKVVVVQRDICDWDEFRRVMKKHGVEFLELKCALNKKEVVDQKEITSLYERGEISLDDIKGCYTATVKKSIVLKMNNTNDGLTIKE